MVCIDPLDGSFNIDVNATIGTIFGVFRRKAQEVHTGSTQRDLLQTGRDMMAAGYIIWRLCTVPVLSTGDGVYGFTLDPLGVSSSSHIGTSGSLPQQTPTPSTKAMQPNGTLG